jgi:peroxiredoxin
VLVVHGEAGVGKTALLEYLVANASGCRIARAAGVESEMELAFAGVHQLCAPLLSHLERLPGPQRDALGTAFGLSAGAAADRFLVGLAVLSLLSEAAEERPLVGVVFYPADWSPVCGDQMALYNDVLPDFRRLGATVLGISVDGVWCHAAFAAARSLHFPLLADFEPKGAVARWYGVYREADGTAQRTLVVIDAEGTVQWSYVSPVAANPGVGIVLAALESISADAPTPYGVIA